MLHMCQCEAEAAKPELVMHVQRQNVAQVDGEKLVPNNNFG